MGIIDQRMAEYRASQLAERPYKCAGLAFIAV